MAIIMIMALIRTPRMMMIVLDTTYPSVKHIARIRKPIEKKSQTIAAIVANLKKLTFILKLLSYIIVAISTTYIIHKYTKMSILYRSKKEEEG